MLRIAFLAALCVWGATTWWTGRPVSQPAGVLAPEPPLQEDLSTPHWFDHGDFQITPLARFQLTARILGREDYHLDAGAALSPVDLAPGWGPMSDSAVLQHFDISQSGRFYFWRSERFPVPRHEVEANSANMHLIPATDDVRRVIEKTREGQIVAMRGYLVRADRSDGWEWQSSMTRLDTGAGACELVWVEDIRIL